jgi:hypothetical protein
VPSTAYGNGSWRVSRVNGSAVLREDQRSRKQIKLLRWACLVPYARPQTQIDCAAGAPPRRVTPAGPARCCERSLQQQNSGHGCWLAHLGISRMGAAARAAGQHVSPQGCRDARRAWPSPGVR